MIKIENNIIRWCLSAVLALLILFGTYRSVFSFAAFLLFGLIFVFCDKETILLQMFFVMPMANIFKMSPGTQSFFTILLLIYVVLHLVLPRRATLFVVMFAVYVVIGELFTSQFNLFRTIKLICNVLFLSSILNSEVKVRHQEIFFSYIVGNIVSSVFGTMNSSFFKIESYIGTVELENPEFGDDLIRFAGLYTDPNYYAVGLIISLCLLVVLFYRKEINPLIAVILAVPMVYFLIQTYSKSAILMLFIPIVMLLYSLYKNRNYFAAILLIISSAAVVYLALTGRIEALEIVLTRLSVNDIGSDTDINEITTGRFDLWIMYAEYLINNIRVSLFGESIGAALINGRAAHNTYLDIFYYLGISGGALLLMSLLAISEQSRQGIRIKRNLLNYSILICILMMYFFLSEIFYFDPPFHIFLAFIILNLPLNKNDEERLKAG